MVRRIATEYKHILLDLSNDQFQQFLDYFNKEDIQTEVRIFENGDKEFILFDEGGAIPLAFRNMGSYLKFEGTSYLIKTWKIAYTLQKALNKFKGHAIVHRIYEDEIIKYVYNCGQVVKISEQSYGDEEHIIYNKDDSLSHIEHLFNENVIEEQITQLKKQIDNLLDQRLIANVTTKKRIDKELNILSRQLFVLEA